MVWLKTNSEPTQMALAGCLGGAIYAALFDWQLLAGAPRTAENLIHYFCLAAFPLFWLLAGQIPIRRAALLAGLAALLLALLFSSASLRFEPPTSGRWRIDPGRTDTTLSLFFLLIAVSAPVLACLPAKSWWPDGARFAQSAWFAIFQVVFSLLAAGFVAALCFLCDALLRSVGITLLSDLADEPFFLLAFFGLVLGLSAAFLSDTLGQLAGVARMLARALRLLLPVLAIVFVVFICSALFSGLGKAFGTSAGVTASCLATIALVLIAASSAAESRPNVVLRLATQVIAMSFPFLMAIAAYAIWLRIDQYGATPRRLAAAMLVLAAISFTLPACYQILRRRGRLTGLSDTLLGSTLCALVLGLLWPSPLFHAEAISAQSQVSRLLSGHTDPKRYDYWPLARQWGRAGAAAGQELLQAGLPPPAESQLRQAMIAKSRYDFKTDALLPLDQAAKAWAAIETTPNTARLPGLDQFAEGHFRSTGLCRSPSDCSILTPEFSAHALEVDLILDNDAKEWVLFWKSRYNKVEIFYKPPTGPWERRRSGQAPASVFEDDFALIRSGAYTLAPVQERSLTIDGQLIFPLRH